MILNHNDFLNYVIPNDWCAEENTDTLLIYDPNGNGAITISFFNVLNIEKSLAEQMSILAKRFIVQNKINLHSHFILFNRDDKTILYGTGITSDSWYIKLWVIAKYPKIVLATYQSERKSAEEKICDSIIDSIQFTF